MKNIFFGFGWRPLAALALLLPSACASPEDEPVPQQHGPQVVVTNPAIIEQDTVVTGQGAAFLVQGYYATEVNGNPVLKVTAKEDNGPLRVLTTPQTAAPRFGYAYLPGAAVRRARIEALLTDKYTQTAGAGFWLRVVPLPGPVVSLAVPLPTYVNVGARLPVRVRLASLTDLPTELRLYRYEPLTAGRVRLTLLGTVGEAALLAARQNGVSEVEFPAVLVADNTVADGPLGLLLFGRTRRRMQAQAFLSTYVIP